MARRRSERTEVQKYLRRAYTHFLDGIEDLATAYSILEPLHKNAAEVVREMGINVMLVLEGIKVVWEELWGPPPDDLTTHH